MFLADFDRLPLFDNGEKYIMYCIINVDIMIVDIIAADIITADILTARRIEEHTQPLESIFNGTKLAIGTIYRGRLPDTVGFSELTDLFCNLSATLLK